jgi:hypothetical protein
MGWFTALEWFDVPRYAEEPAGHVVEDRGVRYVEMTEKQFVETFGIDLCDLSEVTREILHHEAAFG